MGVKFKGEWGKALSFSARAQAAIQGALEVEAEAMAEHLREGLASGSPAGTTLAPLHPVTAAMKGSQIPLAGMEKWVQVKRTGPFKFVAGMVDPEGVRIGLIHEEGRTWTQVWTDRQRRWFFAQLRRLGIAPQAGTGASTGAVPHVIPARPWLAPVAQKYLPDAEKRIRAAVSKNVWR